MNSKQKKKINYQDSGVNIQRADELIDTIKSKAKRKDKNVISGIGGFSSLYRIDKKIKDPVIVSGTDGVGTKLKIAKALKNHKYIGQDLVAMCVNDVVTSGAKPLSIPNIPTDVTIALPKLSLGVLRRGNHKFKSYIIKLVRLSIGLTKNHGSLSMSNFIFL